MPKKNTPIPIITLPPDLDVGILFTRTRIKSQKGIVNEVQQAHRDNWHLLILQIEGSTVMEVDFQMNTIQPHTVFYVHPSQVHRVVSFKGADFYSLIIDNKSLKPEYLKMLEELSPVKSLLLENVTFSLLDDIASICIKIFKNKESKLRASLLKDSCHTFIAAILSQYLAKSNPADTSSRYEIIAKAFKSALEENFTSIKSPKEYAQKLNISTPYLNECVKHATGRSVSYQIQQRIILEAERLLYHSNKSVKEIAHELGYDDHSYFIRLFSRVAGMTPLGFRNKNRE
jgi:AraC-like DNA-binding protein